MATETFAHEEQKVITAETKRQIFRNNPKVKSLFDQLVPIKVIELELTVLTGFTF